MKSLCVTLGAFLVLTMPWVAVLSAKYGRFTISTAARAARVDIGPEHLRSVGRWELIPERDRLSVGETIDFAPAWSPFESLDNLLYQVKLCIKNGNAISHSFRNLDYFALGHFGVLVALVFACFDRRLVHGKKWMCGLVTIVSLAGIYWTTYCYDERYFWVLLPFLLALVLGLTEVIAEKIELSRVATKLLFVLIAVSFMVPQAKGLARLVRDERARHGLEPHRDLAKRLKSKGLSGPIVGSTERSWRCALYVAYFLDEPYYGDASPATTAEFRRSEARIIVVDRQETVAKELGADTHFRDLDSVLFSSLAEASNCELKAFALVR